MAHDEEDTSAGGGGGVGAVGQHERGGRSPEPGAGELEAQAPTRVEGVGEVQAGGVLRLRLVESGTLQVRVGRQVVVDCDVLWGEAERMIFADLAWRPQLLPQVVSREPGVRR